MSFPRYPKYKDSGVAWLGEVPEHWEVRPLKHIAEFINGDAFKPSEWAESGVPIIRIQNLNGGDGFNFFDGVVEDRYLVHDGDLLFGWSGNRGTSFGPFIWRHQKVCALNQHIFRVVPNHVYKNELFWTLKAVTSHVEDQAHGIIGMVHVTKGDLGAINVPVPPENEQTRIAAFLDRETAKIDGLIAEQQRLIDLLKEKRQAVISHAVTKGLNPQAPMKPSGIEWLGDVPAHWTARPVKYLAKIGNGSTPSREVPEYWAECGFPWLNSSVVNKAVVTEAEGFVTERALRECHLPIVIPPSVLVGITGQGRTRGMASMLGIEATINQHVAFVKPNGSDLDIHFLLSVFESAYQKLRRDSEEAGATKGAITCEQIGNLHIPVPPLAEQLKIVEYVKGYCGKIDMLTAETERAISLLTERRTALISAAVTGQIDVRDLASRGDAEHAEEQPVSVFPLRASAPPREPVQQVPEPVQQVPG